MSTLIQTNDFITAERTNVRAVLTVEYDVLSLGFQDFAGEVDAEKTEKVEEKEQRIIKDLNTMSQKEKLKLLKKESPELLELIQDFKAKVLFCSSLNEF